MGGLQDEVDVLRRIPLFANIEPARLKLLAFTSDRVAFSAGQEPFPVTSISENRVPESLLGI